MNSDNPTVSPFTQDDETIFHEPWHAQVLAIADSLVQAGTFSANDWAQTLGLNIENANNMDAPDTAETYYNCALDALETLTAQATSITPETLSKRQNDWAKAYLATPHGQPVKLGTKQT
ncbi:MAG: nitrile hydratase accessory protein [Pseudoruegeria sp.]